MILACILIAIGGVLAVFKPTLFVLFFGLFGSDMDAFGFVGYCKQFISLYDLIMLLFLFVALISAIVRNSTTNKRTEFWRSNKFKFFLVIPIILAGSLTMYFYF